MRTYSRLVKLIRETKDYREFEFLAMAKWYWYLKDLQTWTKKDLRIFYEQHTQTKVESIGGW